MVSRHVNQEHATVRGGKITSPPLGLAEYDIVFPNGVSNRLKMFLQPAKAKGVFRIGQLFYVHLTPQCAEPTYLYTQPPFEQSNTTSCINPATTTGPARGNVGHFGG
jgi:hypothetical protein